MNIQEQIARHIAHIAMNEWEGTDALLPEVKQRVGEFFDLVVKDGLSLHITSVFRSAYRQKQLYEEGRTSQGSVVTNAQPLQSYHNYGLAFDIAFDGDVPYPDDSALWEKVGIIGEAVGLVWGGRWEDKPHFEYHPTPDYEWENLIDYFKIV